MVLCDLHVLTRLLDPVDLWWPTAADEPAASDGACASLDGLQRWELGAHVARRAALQGGTDQIGRGTRGRRYRRSCHPGRCPIPARYRHCDTPGTAGVLAARAQLVDPVPQLIRGDLPGIPVVLSEDVPKACQERIHPGARRDCALCVAEDGGRHAGHLLGF